MKTKVITTLLSAILLLSACGEKKETVRIATKPMTEQFILAEMLSALIQESTPYGVKITKGIGGGTSNIHPALMKGDFDLYPEYTGTGWMVILEKDSFPGGEQLYSELKKEYHDKFGLKWLAPYGFNNAYSLAVNKDKAEKYHLKTFSDLAKYPDTFVLGAEYDFYEIPLGYKDLCDCYQLKFRKNLDMDIGLKYGAIKSGKIDVMNIFTTDGQLSGSGLTVLEDDKHFFPTYYCATVVREDVLAEYPGLEDALNKMDGILTDSEMADLNYLVDVKGRSESDVAREFLQKKGLLGSKTPKDNTAWIAR